MSSGSAWRSRMLRVGGYGMAGILSCQEKFWFPYTIPSMTGMC